jgi:hypothetical protein
MQLIERARRALDRGAATEALRLLLRHARSFRTGQLVEERLALHAITLCATGDFARGRKLSRAFLRRYPRSPMRTRVTSACGE